MGTSISVNFWHEDEAQASILIEKVMDEMRRIDATLSPYKPDSELSRVNRLAAQQTQPISRELAMLLDKSLYFGELSDGAFDITFASIGKFYDYRKGQKPSEQQRLDALPAINYRLIQLNKEKQQVYFGHPHMSIDLGGIAKGYAVDLAAAILQRGGVKHASISAGGDSRIIGDRRGRPWVIGIKNPRKQKGDDETVIRIPLENTAVSTSGDYERYFIDKESGERIHHIINPKTGKSSRGLVSVTILGPSGIDTDALSTTVFVLGIEKGLTLVNKLPGFDSILIDRFGKAHYSDDLIMPTPVN